MEPVRNDTTTDRRTAVELAKRLLVDSIWRTAKIEVDGVTFPDTQEIFDGRVPEGMSVDDIVTVNNIKRAWGFLLENICERENAADVLSDLQAWVGEPFDAAGRRYDGGKESVDRSGRI